MKFIDYCNETSDKCLINLDHVKKIYTEYEVGITNDEDIYHVCIELNGGEKFPICSFSKLELRSDIFYYAFMVYDEISSWISKESNGVAVFHVSEFVDKFLTELEN